MYILSCCQKANPDCSSLHRTDGVWHRQVLIVIVYLYIVYCFEKASLDCSFLRKSKQVLIVARKQVLTVPPSTGASECSTDKLTVSGAVFRDASSRQLQPDSVFCGTKLPRVLSESFDMFSNLFQILVHIYILIN